MKYYLLKCGHIFLSKKDIICERCGCREIDKVFNGVYDGLEGRVARSKKKVVKSRWDLPGFVYQPNKDYDLYFYGR